MNRAARRQKERDTLKAQKLLHKLTPAELDFLKQQIREEVYSIIYKNIEEERIKIYKQAVEDLLIIFYFSLSDEFGFGLKRINRLNEKINKQFECILKELVTIEELKEILIKEKGIPINSILLEQEPQINDSGDTDGEQKKH